MSSDILLELKNLTKTFATGFFGRGKQVVAVDDVSFNCKAGEILGLIGESGSGKTTTARIILKLLSPTSGNIYFKGKEVWSILDNEYYRHVQGVFQDPYASFNPFYKVKHLFDVTYNNILSAHATSSSDQDSITEKVLNLVRLSGEEVLYKYPHELSGGQLQRILLARALLVNPALLVVDEPTSMVDASLRVTILNILKELSKEQNKSIIFITHDISQAFYLCDRIIVMYKGKIVEQGLTEDVIGRPKHWYTQRLIKDVPKLRKKFVDLM